MIHHVATNYLLVNSNYGAFHRYGAVILFLHDLPDIFAALSRIFDAMGNKMLTFSSVTSLCYSLGSISAFYPSLG